MLHYNETMNYASRTVEQTRREIYGALLVMAKRSEVHSIGYMTVTETVASEKQKDPFFRA